MKTSSVLLSLGLAAVASAQLGIDNLPACAQNCADGYLENGIGNCGTDVGCICANAGFISGIACCLQGVCSPSDQTTAVSVAQALCTAYGVSVPSAVSGLCTSSTVSGSGSSSSTTKPASTSATTTAGTSGSTTTAASTTTPSTSQNTGASAANTGSSTSSHNVAPRPTGGAAAAGVLGGLVAAVALL